MYILKIDVNPFFNYSWKLFALCSVNIYVDFIQAAKKLQINSQCFDICNLGMTLFLAMLYTVFYNKLPDK